MDALEVAEQHDQDGQADGGFGGGHGQDEEDEYLPGQVAQEMRKRHEIHVDREQHQLEGHQQDDQVLPVEKDADDADCEKDRAQDKEMREGESKHWRPGFSLFLQASAVRGHDPSP